MQLTVIDRFLALNEQKLEIMQAKRLVHSGAIHRLI